ncbi:hypothetical protein [Mesorhizobium sp. L-8-10]|uniref:hypothetical protein n=1 Tax=Mesorhizobium sp. L-8-10 TaxID=2744523 RepID=UPI00192804A0|nr:hypothetical protein [Mesorhizobium sp. L-8-10]
MTTSSPVDPGSDHNRGWSSDKALNRETTFPKIGKMAQADSASMATGGRIPIWNSAWANIKLSRSCRAKILCGAELPARQHSGHSESRAVAAAKSWGGGRIEVPARPPQGPTEIQRLGGKSWSFGWKFEL